ncbi:hypothetical protein B5M09_011543 [Aphanomyces astaci]|uniref:Restriction endonuclease domain-containing protein n=1 Tax=Aphanomyces astaci TaxID=112090 RepID=A0A3R7YTD0_APHAT|nr:hypothetical protein B5M09_011543 [Aphanomyces astaci]
MLVGGSSRAAPRSRHVTIQVTVPTVRSVASDNTPKLSAKIVKDAIASVEDNTASLFRDDDANLTTPTPPVLVASNVSVVEAQKLFESRVASLATFIPNDATSDIFVIKVPNMEASSAQSGQLRAIAPYMDAHCEFIRGLNENNIIVGPGIHTAPDYVIKPRRLPPFQRDAQPENRMPTPRIIFEIEYSHRNIRQLWVWANQLLADQFVRAVVGILVYHESRSPKFAMLAVLVRRDGGGNVALFDAVSFGTRQLNHRVIAVLSELPFAQGSAFRELPTPIGNLEHNSSRPMPANWNNLNPFITVPGEDVFYQAPSPPGVPLSNLNLVIDLWPILEEVTANFI